MDPECSQCVGIVCSGYELFTARMFRHILICRCVCFEHLWYDINQVDHLISTSSTIVITIIRYLIQYHNMGTLHYIIDILMTFLQRLKIAELKRQSIPTYACSVIVGAFLILLLMLYLQYRAFIWKHIAIEDKDDHREKQQLIFRGKFMVHATQTCTSYVLYVWGVMFTKAFQGVHCTGVGETALLSQDLNMV